MCSAWRQRPVYDRNAPERTGPLVVNYDLDQLKVGENLVVTGRQNGFDLHDQDIAPGDGWCRAVYAPECAWPVGAHLCVVVQWFPDEAFRATWPTRFGTVMAALRSRGFLVEHAGRESVPVQYGRVDMLVYQMEPGQAPPQRPDDAWAYVPPPRTYRWPELSPMDECRRALDNLGIGHLAHRKHRYRATLWDVTSVLWPPCATFCAQLRWWREPNHSAKATGEALSRLLSLVAKAGYRTRISPQANRSVGEHVDVLVYREALHDAESNSAAPDRAPAVLCGEQAAGPHNHPPAIGE